MNEYSIVKTKDIGKNVSIGEFSIIRESAVIEDNVIIHPHVIIESGVFVGKGTEIFPGSIIGKNPKGAGATSREIHYQKKISIGENCAVGPNAIIYYDVEIGNNTLIGDGASIREQVRIGHHCIISRYVTINYNTIIGNNTKIMDLTHLTGNMTVGDNVFISVLVSSTNDNIVIGRVYDEGRILGPIIDNDVTVGAGVTLLPGIHIHEGGFAGAGSVVTKNVEANTLVIGVPAREIKKIHKDS